MDYHLVFPYIWLLPSVVGQSRRYLREEIGISSGGFVGCCDIGSYCFQSQRDCIWYITSAVGFGCGGQCSCCDWDSRDKYPAWPGQELCFCDIFGWCTTWGRLWNIACMLVFATLTEELHWQQSIGRSGDTVRILEVDLPPCRDHILGYHRHRIFYHPSSGNQQTKEKHNFGLFWRVPYHHKSHSPHFYTLTRQLRSGRVACAIHPESNFSMRHPLYDIRGLGVVVGAQNAKWTIDEAEFVEPQRIHHEYDCNRFLLGKL